MRSAHAVDLQSQKTFAHKHMHAEGRQALYFQLVPCRCHRGHDGGCGVMKRQDFEPGRGKVVARFLITRQETVFRHRCPGHREFRRTVRPGIGMAQHEPSAGFQHAERLAIHAGLIGDVHHHVVRVRPIEARVRQWQGKRATFQDPHTIRHAGRRVQAPRRVAERRRQVHAGHRAAILRRDPSRRAANAAADIQDCLSRKRLQQRDQPLGRQHAATVEMIERCQCLRRDRHIGAGVRTQRRDDPGGDGAARA